MVPFRNLVAAGQFSLLLFSFHATNAVAQLNEADIDVLVSKSVDNPAPTGPQHTIQFSIEVGNVGESAAANVVVEDVLPSELAVPEVMSPWASSGDYDPASGQWVIGEMAPGAREVLTIPAVVDVSPQPACIINSASLVGTDANNSNNRSSVALKRPEVERCADLRVIWNRPAFPDNPCGGKGSVSYTFAVQNLGPDVAFDVVLRLSETSDYQLPRFRFISNHCSGLECRWESIPPKSLEGVTAESREFKNDRERQHSIALAVTTADEDYEPANNTLTLTREIPPFNVKCPDFGIPDNVAPGGGAAPACFIATAAYGTPTDARLDTLRSFRDNWLLKIPGGSKLVDSYYEHSPPIAEYIAPRPWLRAVVRALLVPLLWLVEFPIGFLAGAATCLSLLVWRMKRA